MNYLDVIALYFLPYFCCSISRIKDSWMWGENAGLVQYALGPNLFIVYLLACVWAELALEVSGPSFVKWE